MFTLENILNQEAWCALALAILSPRFMIPDQACMVLAKGKYNRRKSRPIQRKDITDEDVSQMVKLKEKLTYKQVGELYGMTADAVYTRIRRYKGVI